MREQVELNRYLLMSKGYPVCLRSTTRVPFVVGVIEVSPAAGDVISTDPDVSPLRFIPAMSYTF